MDYSKDFVSLDEYFCINHKFKFKVSIRRLGEPLRAGCTACRAASSVVGIP